ncbi:hypothetical protein PanWU01x14_333450 [Parasponia andersonii]|uniref:Uncharacterized protein n=1 Tax=Parasponia andersonii TaxID=3476 RepID=A0A2P5AGV4_PARAD|nr:hypothetical protein PanWU01x14_333450 [Parasponia andersonii]
MREHKLLCGSTNWKRSQACLVGTMETSTGVGFYEIIIVPEQAYTLKVLNQKLRERIHGFAEGCKFTGTGLDKLHIVNDGLKALGSVFDLFLNLFDVTTRWPSIHIGKYSPGFTRSL